MYSQEGIELKLISVEATSEEDIAIEVLLRNKSDSIRSLYDPYKDKCLGILILNFVGQDGGLHTFYPCDEIVDLDEVSITSESNICLKKNEEMKIREFFSKDKISPYLGKELYQVWMEWNYSDINFSNTKEGFVFSTLASDTISYDNL
jgi:hypothetical protein